MDSSIKILTAYGLGVITTFMWWMMSTNPTPPSQITNAYWAPPPTTRNLSSDQKELLPFPVLPSGLQRVLRLNEAGILRLEWPTVKGARRTRAYVMDAAGNILFTQSTAMNVIYLNEFKKVESIGTRAFVALKSVDSNGNEGPFSPTYQISLLPASMREPASEPVPETTPLNSKDVENYYISQ